MERITTGTVLQQTPAGKVEKRYEMVYLAPDHVDQVLALQKVVFDALDDRQKFVPDSREFFEEVALVKGKGRMIGVFVENEMIAARSISFPGLSFENLGWELDLSEEDLKRVCHLESSIVHPDFRGNHLQALMLKPTQAYLKEEGYCMILCTISPFNYPSLKNVMDAGLFIRDVKVRGGVYGGKLRFLLALNLCRPVEPVFSDICTVQNTDITVQKTLLALGYAGFSMKKLPGDRKFFAIQYGKPYPPLAGRVAADPLSSI
ncbi:MAG: hypothetical protein SCK57_05435 [Bacillota bacterium]|jgi:hypothetical protein|nr:hypothetical protein [Bacillota bacterium]MDW7677084.1 hypothetical protein [Bacillota bacterium]